MKCAFVFETSVATLKCVRISSLSTNIAGARFFVDVVDELVHPVWKIGATLVAVKRCDGAFFRLNKNIDMCFVFRRSSRIVSLWECL